LVKQALPIVVGLVVTACARKGRSPEGMLELDGLLESANAQVGSTNLSDYLRDFDPSTSDDFLQKLVGGNSGENVMANVSRLTGIPKETATTAVAALAPAILNQLSAAARAKGLDTAGLAGLMGEQGEAIQALGNMDYLLDDVPGIGDDIKRGFQKLFGGGDK